MSDKKIRVLVVDDSAIVRKALQEILERDPEIEIMGTASDPFMAASLIKKEVPDVITLDVEMPRMDGLTFLKKLMAQHPVPTIVISTLTTSGSQTAIRALELGAVEVFAKSTIRMQEGLDDISIQLIDKVKAAALSKGKLTRRVPRSVKPAAGTQDKTLKGSFLSVTTHKIIAIGASTGGTEAIRTFLENAPLDTPGIVIVQHMPADFTRQFAQRLNELCAITVEEAKDGDSVLQGKALIAPGNFHMTLNKSGARYLVNVKEGPLVNRHRPAVDPLFQSVADHAGSNSAGILLTGMGSDGAKGMLTMKQHGAVTIAQDEKTCVVFGMPREAVELGAADHVLPLKEIAPYLYQQVFSAAK